MMNTIVHIDRTVPFDPVKLGFLNDWVIEEQAEDSLILTQINPADIQLESMLRKGEKRLMGEARIDRLKLANFILLDAKIFQILWENQDLIPEQWKGGEMFITFDGTVFYERYQCDRGLRGVLCLHWQRGEWYWDIRRLDRYTGDSIRSAVLAS